jgi:molecular chaperone DnaK
MKLGEAMYQASQGQGGAAGGGPSADAGGPDDKVVDVDFEEVKDDDSKKSA